MEETPNHLGFLDKAAVGGIPVEMGLIGIVGNCQVTFVLAERSKEHLIIIGGLVRKLDEAGA